MTCALSPEIPSSTDSREKSLSTGLAERWGKTNIGCNFRGIKNGKQKNDYLYNGYDHQEGAPRRLAA